MRTARNLFAFALALSPMIHGVAAPREWIAYVGTYTGQDSKGIYAFRFESGSGKMTPLELAGETSNPSFLAVHPTKRFLYAAGEDDSGTVSAFRIESNGTLKLLNSLSSRGSGPCHLSFDRTGKWLFVANYSNGSVASFPVGDNGELGESAGFVQHSGSSVDRQRQAGPHAHSVNMSPDNRFLIVDDLGLDRLMVYRFDVKTGAFTANNPAYWKAAPGAGPRHLTFSPDGKFAWVLNEMNATVTTLSYNKNAGAFTELQTVSALPSDYRGAKSGAEIVVHPNGRFLYASNRGHDSIAIFSIDARKGVLKNIGWVPTQGKKPRHFTIDPTGTYLFAANQDSNSIAAFHIDTKTGGLAPTRDLLKAPVPVCIVLVPAS